MEMALKVVPTTVFRNVGRGGDGGSPRLAHQTERLVVRQLSGEPAARDDGINARLPHLDIGVASRGREMCNPSHGTGRKVGGDVPGVQPIRCTTVIGLRTLATSHLTQDP